MHGWESGLSSCPQSSLRWFNPSTVLQQDNIMDKDKLDLDFLREGYWDSQKRMKDLNTELIKQGETITNIQIKLANQAEQISELQSKLNLWELHDHK